MVIEGGARLHTKIRVPNLCLIFLNTLVHSENMYMTIYKCVKVDEMSL